MAAHDGRDVAEVLTAGVRDRQALEVLGRAERQHRPDLEPLVGAVEEAAGAGRGSLEVAERRDQLRVAGGVDDLAELHAICHEPLGVDLNLHLRVLLAEDRHVGDPLNP